MTAQEFRRHLAAFQAYNASKALSQRTLQTYDLSLQRFHRWFIETHGGEVRITARHIREYAAHRLASGKKGLTVRGELTALRAFYRFATYDEVIPEERNPIKRVPNPRCEAREIVPLSMEEIRRLLRSFDMDDPVESRNHMICLLILDTGLRIGEVATLKVDDVDLGRLRIDVIGKGRKRRTVYVGRRTAQALADYLDECRPEISNGHGTLFPPAARSPHPMLRPRHISYVIKAKMDEVGIPRCNSSGHRLRHTFAVNFIRAGANVFALQKLLGHSTLEMTRRYVMLLEDDLAEEHRRASPMDRMAI